MKNPLAFIKHIVKDPVNTIDEANVRKKEIIPWFYGFLGLMIVGVILQIALDLGFMVIFSTIGLFGAGFFVFLLAHLQDIKERFSVLTCDKCGTLTKSLAPEDFSKYVSFTVEKDEAIFKGYSGNKEPTNGVYSLVKYSGSSHAVASVQLTCPHCGEVNRLRYSAEPFKCHAEAKNVGALNFPTVRTSLETAVRAAVNDYNDPNKKDAIPYSLHSSKNPHFEERTTFKGANASGAHPDYMGARIDVHQDVEEMLEHYFTIPMINGTLINPSKPRKSFFARFISALKP